MIGGNPGNAGESLAGTVDDVRLTLFNGPFDTLAAPITAKNKFDGQTACSCWSIDGVLRLFHDHRLCRM